MRFNLHADVNDFYGAAYDVLMRDEAQNLIPLGNLLIGRRGEDKTGWRDPANWFMATVTDSIGVRLTAIMTPPHNLVLYATDNATDDAAINCLINGMDDIGVITPGVMTEKTLAERFTGIYTHRKSMGYKVEMDQRIYELTRINDDIKFIGALRLAEERDMAFLPYWAEGFYTECNGLPLRITDDAEGYRYHITQGKCWILEDNGVPVSMAKATREMQTVCGVAFVYTPPYFRGRGYATSCVAGVSRIILERGYKKCVLYTDLSNPTSNSIYMKIGYTPICDSLQIKFD